MLARLVVVLALLLGPALAQEPDPIQSFVASLNHALEAPDASRLAPLVAADADYRVGGRLVATGPVALADALYRRPFSEQTAPRIVEVSVRLLSPDIALIDACQVSYGSQMGKQSLPVFLVLQRSGATWQVRSWRVAVTTFFPRLVNASRVQRQWHPKA